MKSSPTNDGDALLVVELYFSFTGSFGTKRLSARLSQRASTGTLLCAVTLHSATHLLSKQILKGRGRK